MQVGYWRSVTVGGYFHGSEFGTQDGSTVLLAGGHPSRQQHYNQKVSAKLLTWQTRDLNVCLEFVHPRCVCNNEVECSESQNTTTFIG